MATRKQWINESLKWIKRFGMDKGHSIEFEFENDDKLNNDGDNSVFYMAGTSSLPRYRDHTIHVSKNWLKNTNKNELEDTACHEAIHLVTSPIGQLFRDIIDELPKSKQEVYKDWFTRENEEVTTHLTDIMLNQARTWKDN